MNRLRREIRSSLHDLELPADGSRSARFRFPADFVGFQGHFPGQPVLPGICLVLAALALAEAPGGATLRLLEVVSAKFTAPAGAGEDLRAECRTAEEEGGSLHLRAVFLRGSDKVARLELRARRAAPGEAAS